MRYDHAPRDLPPGPDSRVPQPGAHAARTASSLPAGAVRTTGNIIFLPITKSTVRDLVVGLDGAVWFTEYEVNQIGRITMAGGVATALASLPIQVAPLP